MTEYVVRDRVNLACNAPYTSFRFAYREGRKKCSDSEMEKFAGKPRAMQTLSPGELNGAGVI